MKIQSCEGKHERKQEKLTQKEINQKNIISFNLILAIKTLTILEILKIITEQKNHIIIRNHKEFFLAS